MDPGFPGQDFPGQEHQIRRVRVWAAARRLTVLPLAIAVALGFGASLAGCSLATAVKKQVSTIQANRGVIDLFTAKLKSGQPPQFETSYVTTGGAPTSVVYAVRPPSSLLFSSARSSGSPLSTARVIMNPSGAYACTSAPGAGWVCDKLTKSSAAAQRKLLDFYTPAHWVAFLRGLAVTAGFAGDKISSSAMTLNGFRMQCLDLRATGVAGISKICTTVQHLLGYLQVASVSTSFVIKSYSSSPAASLFGLPPGAKVHAAKTAAK
jgi:hypothetical protein